MSQWIYRVKRLPQDLSLECSYAQMEWSCLASENLIFCCIIFNGDIVKGLIKRRITSISKFIA